MLAFSLPEVRPAEWSPWEQKLGMRENRGPGWKQKGHLTQVGADGE